MELSFRLNESDPKTVLYYGINQELKFQLPAGYEENNREGWCIMIIKNPPERGKDSGRGGGRENIQKKFAHLDWNSYPGDLGARPGYACFLRKAVRSFP